MFAVATIIVAVDLAIDRLQLIHSLLLLALPSDIARSAVCCLFHSL